MAGCDVKGFRSRPWPASTMTLLPGHPPVLDQSARARRRG
jgi:hypothetical protein